MILLGTILLLASCAQRRDENLESEALRVQRQESNRAREQQYHLRFLNRLRREPDITALPFLLKALHADYPAVRLAAIEMLAPMSFGPEYGVAESLTGGLDDSSSEVRAATILALGEQARNRPLVLLPLLGRLGDKDPVIRSAINDALAATRDSLVISGLLARLRDRREESEVRADAAEILGQIRARRTFHALAAELNAPDDIVRRAVVRALPAFGESLALGPLLSLLQPPATPGVPHTTEDERADLRHEVIHALGRLDRPGSLKVLIGVLGDSDPGIVTDAVRNLGARGDAAAARPLVALLLDRPIPGLAARHAQRPPVNFGAVRRALAAIGPAAVPAVLFCLESADPEIRLDGIRILGRIGGDPARAGLATALADWPCGPDAAQALKRLGWYPGSAADTIHYLIALRRPAELFQQAEEFRRVLLDDADSGTTRALENAVFALLSAGNTSTTDDLIRILNRRGTRTVAESFINSGSNLLETAGRNWARAHGYVVLTENGPGDVRWGSWQVAALPAVR